MTKTLDTQRNDYFLASPMFVKLKKIFSSCKFVQL
jgi:hypothetical protein